MKRSNLDTERYNVEKKYADIIYALINSVSKTRKTFGK